MATKPKKICTKDRSGKVKCKPFPKGPVKTTGKKPKGSIKYPKPKAPKPPKPSKPSKKAPPKFY